LLPSDAEPADDIFITSTTLEIDGKKVGGKGKAQKVLQAAFEKFVESYVGQASGDSRPVID
jgi:hypothetical protein